MALQELSLSVLNAQKHNIKHNKTFFKTTNLLEKTQNEFSDACVIAMQDKKVSSTQSQTVHRILFTDYKNILFNIKLVF